MVSKLVDILSKYNNYEIIFIDDCSTDKTLTEIVKARKKNKSVKYVSFSRHFGHQNALRAGYDYATGDCVICMDADFQQPPEFIPRLITKWEEGFDIVGTIRKDVKEESFFKRKTARYFYWMINKLSDINIEQGAADFRLLDKNVVNVIKNYKEKGIFYRGLVTFIGFKKTYIEYIPQQRLYGKSKYSLGMMFNFALDGIIGFSMLPLKFSGIIGLSTVVLSVTYLLFLLIFNLFSSYSFSFVHVMLGLIFLLGGIQLIAIAILGEYVSRIFCEVRGRPSYIIKEKKL
jgi:dolichol-phosphate mannosyltransferase